jgi:hypothetical protein
VGLTASLLLCRLALAFLEGDFAGATVWWLHPPEGLRRLSDALFAKWSGRGVFSCMLLAAGLSAVWSLVGGWIARAELLQHRRTNERGETADSVQAPPTPFVLAKARSLYMAPLMILLMIGCFSLFGLPIGGLNWIPWIGPVLVSLLLPFVVFLSLWIVLALAGSPSCTIMPAALAAEGVDFWDAVSRGYSYLYSRPLHFGWWLGLSLAIAGLPLAGVLWLLSVKADVINPTGGWLAGAAATALSFSLFWTQQGLVYLKMRRLVDETAEDEIWDGPLVQQGAPSAATPPASRPVPAKPEGNTKPAHPPWTAITFWETVTVGGGSPASLALLLPGILWTVLVLAGGALAVWYLAGAQGNITVAGVWQAARELAEQRPAILAAVAVVVVVLGAVGITIPSKAVARRIAVRMTHNKALPLKAAWSFARRTRGPGVGTVLLLTVGMELYLATLALLLPAVQGEVAWQEVLVVGASGLAFSGIGALGLGAAAVEGSQEEARPGVTECLAGNGPETLTSAAATLVYASVRLLLIAGFAWLTWLVACEILGWWGGDVRWARWGLDGSLMPAAGGRFRFDYQAASAIAGLWFLALAGLVLAYPISYAVGWGVTCYLRARQQARDIPPHRLELSEEEQQALEAQPKKAEGGADALSRAGPPSPLAGSQEDTPDTGDEPPMGLA